MATKMEKLSRIFWTMLYWCKTCKQQKRPFKVDIKTKLRITKDLCEWFSSDT